MPVPDTVPALMLRAPLANVIVCPIATLPAVALRTSPPAPPLSPALTMMLRSAVKVRLLALDQVTALTTVMSPAAVAPALAVVTTTLAVVSAVCNIDTVSRESTLLPFSSNCRGLVPLPPTVFRVVMPAVVAAA